MIGAAAVGFSISLVAIIDTWGGIGVSVGGIMKVVGVHEGTNVNRGITVTVAVAKAGFEVAGGNGLRLLFGSTYIRKKTDTTQSKIINTKTVKIFHSLPDFFLRGGSFASENSYPSIDHLPN